jgi:hypothetical protein
MMGGGAISAVLSDRLGKKDAPTILRSDIGLMTYFSILSKYLDVSAFFLALIDIALDTL